MKQKRENGFWLGKDNNFQLDHQNVPALKIKLANGNCSISYKRLNLPSVHGFFFRNHEIFFSQPRDCATGSLDTVIRDLISRKIVILIIRNSA